MMIYVIDDGRDNYKIGTSGNVERRLNSLKTGNAAKLKVLFTFDGDMKIERAIHKELKAYRKSGEWFSYRESDLEKYDFRFGNFIKYLEMDGAKVLEFDTSELAHFLFDPVLAKKGVPVLNLKGLKHVP